MGLNSDYGLVLLDDVLLHWADEVVVMSEDQREYVEKVTETLGYKGAYPIVCLNIPDNFAYRDPELMELIASRYREYLDKVME